MAASIPLPRKVRQMIDATRMPHPGLALDKYAMSYLAGADAATFQKEVQRPAIERVVRLSKAFAPDGPKGLSLKALLARRQGMLEDLGASFLRCETTAPLTLHLARASALENAGICLHQVYGFVYLPGSGLKGMARAFAEKVWLPAQDDTAVARASLLAVFGNEQGAAENHAGGVVFHDAWPETWPVLQTDIVNNHHSGYYGGSDAPGDWDDPIPVNFLSVVPGTSFSFAFSCRRQGTPELLSLTHTFLLGALCHLGAGAKTNAGYGCFRPLESSSPELPTETRQVFATTIELVTPAFLAGADQKAEDCQLRGATLRGLLRWWWRTLHAGHVAVDSLRRMEAALWGDTEASGAVRLIVVPEDGQSAPERYAYKEGFRPKRDFKEKHDLQPSGRQATQGLFYLSYGMDDGKSQRWYRPVGSRWQVRLICREVKGGKGGRSVLPASLVIEQAKCALWLLCQFGGVGSKGRNGFGSLQAETEGIDLAVCKASAQSLRDRFGVSGRAMLEPRTPALESISTVTVETPWRDVWFVLDQLGAAAQAYAQKFKHDKAKLALGLPRKIHGPRKDKPMNHQDRNEWKPAFNLRGSKGTRHASPAHFHLAREADGTLTIRIVAFPSAVLPDFATSQRFLKSYLEHLRQTLSGQTKKLSAMGKRGFSRSQPVRGPHARIEPSGLEPKPERPAAQPLEEEKETWGEAILTYAKNTQEVTATFEGASASSKKHGLIPEELMKKLMAKKKRKPVKAKVDVIKEGNKLTIAEIHPLE